MQEQKKTNINPKKTMQNTTLLFYSVKEMQHFIMIKSLVKYDTHTCNSIVADSLFGNVRYFCSFHVF